MSAIRGLATAFVTGCAIESVFVGISVGTHKRIGALLPAAESNRTLGEFAAVREYWPLTTREQNKNICRPCVNEARIDENMVNQNATLGL